MKKLLIITGPQGSGNHVWSKIFALHHQVQGWQALQNEYWVGHDQEPFAHCWENPDLLKEFDWSQSEYFVTSISVPYINNGTPTVPNILQFAATAIGCGVKVKLAILGRDKNILEFQETRVRGQATFNTALNEYQKLTTFDPTFLSYELLQLYRSQYLKQLSNTLEFPIAYNHTNVDVILSDNANSKYFNAIDHHWVDDLAHKASSKRQ
jgi:hypothetical protein